MNFRTCLAASAVALSLTASGVLAQPAPAAPPVLTTKMVKPSLYIITGAGGNVVVRTAPEGVIVIDTKNPGQAIYDALMAQIRAVSTAPIKYVIDSHHHADHTGNNGRFIAAGVPVVAQETIKPGLAFYQPTPATPNTIRPADPTQTYKTDLTLTVGKVKAELHHFSSGHTRADTVIYFPDIKTIVMGDELVMTNPTYDYPQGTDLAGWLNSLDQAMKLDWDLAVPGHGDGAMTRAEVQVFRGKLATFRDRVRELVKAGTPKEELVSKIRLDDLGWSYNANFWALPGRLDGLYAEGMK